MENRQNVKRLETHFVRFSSYRGSRQDLVQARTFACCSRKLEKPPYFIQAVRRLSLLCLFVSCRSKFIRANVFVLGYGIAIVIFNGQIQRFIFSLNLGIAYAVDKFVRDIELLILIVNPYGTVVLVLDILIFLFLFSGIKKAIQL